MISSSRILCALALLVCAPLFAAGDTREQIEFFERKIRPVLVKHCYECHSADSDIVQAGLRVDHPEGMTRGGDSGPAIQPGQPDKSLLLAAIRYDDIEMPPDGRLGEEVVRDFEKWIQLGAIDPRQSDAPLNHAEAKGIDWKSAKQFWSFQLPQLHEPPKTKENRWPRSKLDGFVLAKLEANGIAPNREADRHTLIRRLSFDLIGLPPTSRAVDRFVNDDHPMAVERLVDRLLADPRAAERWTRLWLDVVRYAEDQAHIVGNNASLTYPNAYLYRDWVISALAQDMPYDEFIRLQLAADLLHPSDMDSHLALGLIGLGPKYYRRNDPEVMADEWEDRVDTVSRGLLGLTVACARCHDHKFDPIPTSDYYALAGVFASTQMLNRPMGGKADQKDAKSKKPADAIHIVRDGKPRDLNVLIRGDVNNKGPVVPRHFLTAISAGEPARLQTGSGRGDLANAIADDQNPLTARVIVNRVWMQLMGSALVATPSNFGALGERPTHPNLLDDLSVRFMQNGWSLKWLQREIVLSATYRQSSEIDPQKQSVDPENRLRWRMPRRRLSAEAYRDALLSVSGGIDLTVGGKSIRPDDASSSRRTVYSKISRLTLNPMLARFDFPDPNNHSAARYETTTPLQKLFLLNSPFLVRQSERLAQRLLEFGGANQSKIEYAYKTLYGRRPTTIELEMGQAFVAPRDLDQHADENRHADQQALYSQYVQALMIANEMFIID